MENIYDNEKLQAAFNQLEELAKEYEEQGCCLYVMVSARNQKDETKTACSSMLIGGKYDLIKTFRAIFKDKEHANFRKVIINALLPKWLVKLKIRALKIKLALK